VTTGVVGERPWNQMFRGVVKGDRIEGDVTDFQRRKLEDPDLDRDQDAVRPQELLSVTDGIFLMVGMVIGVGIFKAPSIVAATPRARRNSFRLAAGRCRLPLRRARLRGARVAPSGHRRRVRVPFRARWDAAPGFSSPGRASRDPDRRDRCGRVRLRRLRSEIYSFGTYSSAIWAALSWRCLPC